MLNATQLQTLKAAIAAEVDPSFVEARNNGQTPIMTAFFNGPSSPAHNVWRTDASVTGIIDAINWALYTPVDALSSSASQTNQLLAIQTKQMNLQMMLQGRERIDASKSTLRAGLRDATIQVPAGSGGSAVSPGGANAATVLAACIRNATRGERLFATQDAQTGATTAKLLVFEGAISDADVSAALELP